MVLAIDSDSVELLQLAEEVGDPAFLAGALDMISDVLEQPHDPKPAIVRDKHGVITALDYP